MLLSIFGHMNVAHLVFNMVTLYSFGPVGQYYFGREYFMSFYLTAGVTGNLFSHFFSVATRHIGGGLGASGAILGLLGLSSFVIPNAEALLFFVIPLKMHYIAPGMMAFDTIGLTGLWHRLIGIPFDHAAHLGGLGFGVASVWSMFRPELMPLWKHPNIPLHVKLNYYLKYVSQK